MFAKKFLKYTWVQSNCTTEVACDNNEFESHVCTYEELGPHYNTGRLYICPPADKLSFYNNFEYFPYNNPGFFISANYNNGIPKS
jgi:hypothetical protein